MIEQIVERVTGAGPETRDLLERKLFSVPSPFQIRQTAQMSLKLLHVETYKAYLFDVC